MFLRGALFALVDAGTAKDTEALGVAVAVAEAEAEAETY
jgi:hypothetical protein